MKRRGFTLIELLIAGALGVTVLGIGLQQLGEYFRLQQVLITRTQLRQDAAHSLERIAKHLRYCPVFGTSAQGAIGLKPIDDDHNAVLTAKDRYELVLWRVIDDPLDKGSRILQENAITVPAFLPTENYDQMLRFFEGRMGRGTRLASRVDKLEVAEKGRALAQLRMQVSQVVAQQKEPVTIKLTELVSVRSHLIFDPLALPTAEAVLEKLKKVTP